MSKALKIILVIIIGSVFAVGISNAHGETFEDHLSFPIPENVISTEKKGHLESVTDTELVMSFTYRFTLGQNGTEWIERLYLNNPITPPADIDCPDRFTKNDDGQCVPVIVENDFPEKPDDLVTFENRLIELDEKEGAISADDWQERKSLQDLLECHQGLDQTKGIQSIRSFWTSAYDKDSLIPIAGDADVIDLAIEECRGQKEIERMSGRGEPTRVGDYLSAQDYFGSMTPTHQDKAIVNWERVPNHSDTSSAKIRQGQIIDTFIKDQSLMCNSDKVLPSFKVKNGCNMEQINIPLATSNTKNGITIYAEPLLKKQVYDHVGDYAQLKQSSEQANIEREFHKKNFQIANSTVVEVNEKTITEQIKEIEAKGWNIYPEAERPEICFNGGISSYLHYLQTCGSTP